jgi:predicted NBD/HSP70 family sugar kinase
MNADIILQHNGDCTTCPRRHAVANAYAEHVAIVEHERDEARADCATYREITQAALDGLHHVTAERDRLALRVRQLLEQLRGLRADDRRAA